MAGTTSRLGIPYPQGPDPFTVSADMQAIAEAIDGAAVYDQGALSGRPSAGIPGRLYFATDAHGGTLFLDRGTSWVAVHRAIPPQARIRRTANFTVPNNVTTEVPLDVVDFDPYGMSDGTGLVLSEDGLYAFTGWADWNANITGSRILDVRDITANRLLAVDGFAAWDRGGGTLPSMASNVAVKMSAGDQVRLRAAQTSGGNLTLPAFTHAPALHVVRIGGAA